LPASELYEKMMYRGVFHLNPEVTMPAISLRAHFDGQRIQLDEPYELATGVPLLVTVLSTTATGPDLNDWAGFAANGLARAYGEHEPEYSSADVSP
jgi:hypothetical protein